MVDGSVCARGSGWGLRGVVACESVLVRVRSVRSARGRDDPVRVGRGEIVRPGSVGEIHCSCPAGSVSICALSSCRWCLGEMPARLAPRPVVLGECVVEQGVVRIRRAWGVCSRPVTEAV